MTSSALAITGVATLPATAATAPTISIDDPGAVTAGPVALTGRVFQGSADTTTVLYALDATDSTALPAGGDCNGDGAVDGADDLNGDGSAGDTLDCEISGVRAIDSQLAASAGGNLQVGLVAFANEAAAADLSPDGSAVFVPPGYTGGDAQPRVVAAAASVTRNAIGQFDPKSLGGSGAGTAFDNAVNTSLATLAQAPAGPKWVMFLSDGAAPLDPATLESLRVAAQDSGVRLRSFAIGGSADCNASGGLAKLAAATGETCVDVANPAALAASLQGSSPESISGVSVTIGGVAFAADVDPVGAWRVNLALGQGSYKAAATVKMTSGASYTTERTFSVGAAPAPGPTPPGSPPPPPPPPPNSVAAATGTLLATQVAVEQPQPIRKLLPKRVTGTVGTPGTTPKATATLNGATVLLQGRGGAGAPWVTVSRSTVKAGTYSLTWLRKKTVRSLRVALEEFHGMAASTAAVPVPRISDCRRVDGKGKSWTLTCHTTAKKGKPASLLLAKQVVDRDKVSKGVVAVTGKGKIGRYVLVIVVSKKTTLRLPL